MATMCLTTVFIGFIYVRIAVMVLDRSRKSVRKVWLAQCLACIQGISANQLARIVFADNYGIGQATLLGLRSDLSWEARV